MCPELVVATVVTELDGTRLHWTHESEAIRTDVNVVDNDGQFRRLLLADGRRI